MRLAAIVAASYGVSPALPFIVGGEQAARAVHDSLAVRDTGFASEWFEARRELPESLEQLLSARHVRPASILFYFGGCLLSQPGRAPALALDGPRVRAYPLPRLCALLARFSDEYLVLLDVSPNSPGDRPEALADAAREALADYHPAAGGLVSVTASANGDRRHDFTTLALRQLGRLRREPGGAPVTASRWFAELRAGVAALAGSHAVRCVPPGRDFVLFPGALPAPGPVASRPERSSGAGERPSSLRELAARAQWLFARQDWRGLAEVYEAMLEHAEGEYFDELAGRLGALCRAELQDAWRAITVLERYAAAGSTGSRLRFELSELYITVGELDLALEQCLAGLAAEPRAVSAHRCAAWIFAHTGQHDRAWNAVSVLNHLQAADREEAAFARSRRPEGLLPATASLTEQDWKSGLARPGDHALLEQVIGIVGPAAVAHRLKVLAKQKRVLRLDPAERQDPQLSTTTLCRSFAWTARLLSVEAPALYLREGTSAEMKAIPAALPSTRVSKVFASGLTLPELAFLWARHLSEFRPEHSICTFYSTAEELLSLLRAAELACRFSPLKARDEDPDTARLAAHLHRSLSELERSRLAATLAHAPQKSFATLAARFLRASRIVAHRAGLLACGDVGIAADTIARFPGEDGASDPTGDLLAWAVSDAYASLRRRLGVCD